MITKRGTTRLRAGRQGLWRISVRNTGRETARNVVITDVIPRGMVVRSRSAGGRIVSGRVVWTIKTLRPKASHTVWVRLGAPVTARGRTVNRATVKATNMAKVQRAQRTVTFIAAAPKRRPVPVVG